MLTTHKKITHFNHLCLKLTSKNVFIPYLFPFIFMKYIYIYLVTAVNRKHCSPFLGELTYSLYTEEKDLRELKRTVF